MRVLLLADVNSSHTQKWATELVNNNIHVGVFSISAPAGDWFGAFGVQVFVPKAFKKVDVVSGSLISKIRYLKLVPHLKQVIQQFKPDILHAHYASSYGLIGALAGFHPFVVSVWGSDIYFFSKLPIVGKAILRYNFHCADMIMSTSQHMVAEINKCTNKQIIVTPFGIDLDFFKPMEVDRIFASRDIVIGTVKSLEPVYGVEFLIKAFSLLKQRFPEMPLKLLIVGEGSLRTELENLAHKLVQVADVVFTGKVPYSEVPQYHNQLDIYAALSLSESFGVAVLEASACEKPVVVSKVGGLPEVVLDGITGFLVQSANAIEAADALEKLILDKVLRRKMGLAGRELVSGRYNLDKFAKTIIPLYMDLIKEA